METEPQTEAAGSGGVNPGKESWEAARALGRQLDIPVGPYEAKVPTVDEMNAVLLYIVDRAARCYEKRGSCGEAEAQLSHVLGINVPRQGFPRSDGFSRHGLMWDGFNADGFDLNGFNRDGFNRRGYNKDGFDKDGYNMDGYDSEGFNKRGRNYFGTTRQQHVEEQVAGWSPEFAAAIAAHVAALQAQAPKKATKPRAKKATVKAADGDLVTTA